VRHVLNGNLTGEHPEGGEQYETVYTFDGADRLVAIAEQNGRKRSLTYKARMLVLSDDGSTWHFRTQTADDGTYEAIDDGSDQKEPSWKT
jgi:YD repeat-containing protein